MRKEICYRMKMNFTITNIHLRQARLLLFFVFFLPHNLALRSAHSKEIMPPFMLSVDDDNNKKERRKEEGSEEEKKKKFSHLQTMSLLCFKLIIFHSWYYRHNSHT
jgi:hypothetical protein